MTDKQIIIDGVDVADCEYLNACSKKMECVILQDDVFQPNPYCEGFNCYYKQLKVKEQECERLKEKLIKWLGKEGLRQSEKEFYEQQFDQLKEKLNKLKSRILCENEDDLLYELMKIIEE